MASEPTDATAFLIVRMGAEGFTIIGEPITAEGAAKAKAESLAQADKQGYIFGVFAKIGTARKVERVEWRGRNG